SSKASPTAPKAIPWSSPGATFGATGLAITSNASWSARAGRPTPTWNAPPSRPQPPADEPIGSRLSRPGALIAAFVLVVTACGGSAVTPTPASSGGTASAPASVAPPSKGPATVPPGGPVEIRWYCCLGGGEAPEQKAVEDKVVADFNASHPNIHLTFEVVVYDQANGQLATELQSG